MKERNNDSSKIPVICLGTALCICGMIVVPKIIDRAGRQVYKKTTKASIIDFDHLGPIIKRK